MREMWIPFPQEMRRYDPSRLYGSKQGISNIQYKYIYRYQINEKYGWTDSNNNLIEYDIDLLYRLLYSSPQSYRNGQALPVRLLFIFPSISLIII